MIAVTGANGHLGGLVIDALLRTLPATEIVATVRSLDKGAALAAKGVQVRVLDYDRPETFAAALAGVDKLLLISGLAPNRVEQHQAVIRAAEAAGVKLVGYTSILHADTTPIALGIDHRRTEADLAAAGVAGVVFRNGWYMENYDGAVGAALQHKAFVGSAGEGRISVASRADYADAIAAVLTSSDDQAGRVYELAGDRGYTMAEIAAAVGEAAGEAIGYTDMPESAYQGVLVGAGLPEGYAAILAQADASAAGGALFDDGRQLSALTGRPTITPGEWARRVVQPVKA